jgi:hypothetical protein
MISQCLAGVPRARVSIKGQKGRIYAELAETREQRELREFTEFIERRGGTATLRDAITFYWRRKTKQRKPSSSLQSRLFGLRNPQLRRNPNSNRLC